MDRVHGLGSWIHDIVNHSRSLILRSVARILLKWKGIGDLISAVDQGVDDWGRASEVAAQRAVAPFLMRFDPTDAAQRGNSPRGSSSGKGRSRVRNGGFFIVTLAGDEELLQSTSGFKNRTRSFPSFPSWSLAGSIAPKGGENLSSVVT
jgi:hypothetical protein